MEGYYNILPNQNSKKSIIDKSSVQMLPKQFCIKNNIVILGRVNPKDEYIAVGMLNPNNYPLIDCLEAKFKKRVIPVQLTLHQIYNAIKEGFSQLEPVVNEDLAVVCNLNSKDMNASRIVDSLLEEALKKRATDIHIENSRLGINVRYRIDGMLCSITSEINKDNIKEVISRIKVLSSISMSENRVIQEGSLIRTFKIKNQKYTIPFRVSIMPGLHGEDVVIRILNRTFGTNLNKLGMLKKMFKNYISLLNNTRGLICIVGPTGSGKTTTFYSTLSHIQSPSKKILSAESPIENIVDEVMQKETTRNIKLANLVDSFLHQDPDMICIGEIYDYESASVAIKASQAGHTVLTTLHANDAVSAISRLLSLGISPYLISSSLAGVLAQRLVRANCPYCLTEYKPDPMYLKLLGKKYENAKFYHSVGCVRCSYSKFSGQTAIFELFTPDGEICEMINSNASISQIQRKAYEKGMMTFTEDAIEKVLNGITTIEEVVNTIPKQQLAMQLKVLRSDELSNSQTLFNSN